MLSIIGLLGQYILIYPYFFSFLTKLSSDSFIIIIVVVIIAASP